MFVVHTFWQWVLVQVYISDWPPVQQFVWTVFTMPLIKLSTPAYLIVVFVHIDHNVWSHEMVSSDIIIVGVITIQITTYQVFAQDVVGQPNIKVRLLRPMVKIKIRPLESMKE